MSPASGRARKLILGWMKDAGLRTWVDQMGHESQWEVRKSEVTDRGDCISDEEGVRFQSTFLGSAALAGILPVSTLHIANKRAATVKDALKENSFEATEESLLQLKYDPKAVWGYIKVHIEQGPVLESLGLPLGVVNGIAGQTRLKVTVKGSQGHAGTVPMSMRQDPMTAAAELIILLESLFGEISSWPGASNVIPGQVVFTVDLRAIENMVRETILSELSHRMYQICDRHSVYCIIDRHDAMALSHLSKVGMLFVRCRGGISHSPAEHVLDDDVWVAGLAVLAFLESNLYSSMQKVQHNFKKVQLKMLLDSAGTMMTVLCSQVHSRNCFKPMKIIHKASRRISRESEFFMYATPAQPLRNKTAKPNIGID
ncbi:hypothetical protein GIB67_012325 [Kingdonia uniflora]|uniref:Peptidase M20 dimerisation domain-containing protein n=1 Tax=Kingdonia uniflora TaxID=39325 RepID=A0A7J7MW42_9MAGN|nr:hypothetical protein GIB67_012325 [Kingdonia uniflora]